MLLRVPFRRALPATLALSAAVAPLPAQDTNFVAKQHYIKRDYMVPMRDGVKLFTIVYTPRDTTRIYPILLVRTPYSIRPYEPDEYRRVLGPSQEFDKDGYIFVFQDVRGKFRSEGEFEVMRPFKPSKRTPKDVDESSDTYDTIDWLLKSVPRNNGRVGMWGISYPGWQTVMGMMNAHPALKAASPQASPSDMFIGDDFHHNGAFRLMYAFSWLAGNARTRTGQSTARGPPSTTARRMAIASSWKRAHPRASTRCTSRAGAGVERLHEAPELRRVLESAERPEGSRNRSRRPADSERRGLVRCRGLLRSDEHLLHAREAASEEPQHARRRPLAARRLEQHDRRSARQHPVRLADEPAFPDRGPVPVLPVSPEGHVRQAAAEATVFETGRTRGARTTHGHRRRHRRGSSTSTPTASFRSSRRATPGVDEYVHDPTSPCRSAPRRARRRDICG